MQAKYKIEVTYRGVTFQSLYECWKHQPDETLVHYANKEPVKMFKRSYQSFIRYFNLRKGSTASRVHASLYAKKRGRYNMNPQVWKGKKYRSTVALYNALTANVEYKRPVPWFNETIKKKGLKYACENVTVKPEHPKDFGFTKSSKELEGCPSIVWQRVNKLGWSVEKAKMTPINRQAEPHPVVYKGKRYSSIRECYYRVRPGVSIPKFTSQLRESGLILDPNAHALKSVKRPWGRR